MEKKVVKLEHITRIEGRLNITIVLKGSEIVSTKAEALEGTRLLEKILIGRKYYEIPDIVSRMCGVCQAIHRVTAVQALEKAFNIEIPDELKMIRELVVLSGQIQSHVLHLYAFVLPDFLGYSSMLEMFKKYGSIVKSALKLKKLANRITEITGGRAVHPITPIVGGLSKIPLRRELESILYTAKNIKNLCMDLIDIILSLDMPDFKRKTNYLSLYSTSKYPILEGDSKIYGKNVFRQEEYDKYIEPIPEEYSYARHYILKGIGEYMVGALARFNNNYQSLSEDAREIADKYDLKFPSYSPFDNNKAQAIEMIHLSDAMIEIAEELIESPPKIKRVKFDVKEGNGISITEAPRGLLIHHYKVSKNGKIVEANIITPTAQNYKNIEADIKSYLPKLLAENSQNIKLEIEKLVRAYDPCVSCSARFLKL